MVIRKVRMQMGGEKTSTRIYTIIFLGVFAAYVLASLSLGTLNALPELGDGQDYDSIAFNIWQGRGFGHDWDDPEWRRPYLGSPIYKDVLNRHSEFYPTTYRPPALPYLLALVYELAGRNFAAWRIVNCAIMAGAVTIAAAISARFAGPLAAIMTAFLALLSPQLTASSQRFLTEALATFLVTLLAWTWLCNARRGWTIAGAALLGIVLGALVAARSIFVLWVPLALLVPGSKNSAGKRRAWVSKAVCILACLVVIGPWWVRNILVTRDFMPFGTQAAIGLPGGFGPRALEFQGVWKSDTVGIQELQALHLDPQTFETRLAKFRSNLTMRWMREHPLDVLRLMFLHVWQELRPRGFPFAFGVLLAGGLGAVLFRRSPGVGIITLLVFMNIVGVALTYSAEGRFMIPVQLLLVALTGALVGAAVAPNKLTFASGALQLHQEEILANYDRIRRKPLLRRIYASFYHEIAERLASGDGQIVEIGSGIGGLKAVVPNCISTDLFPNPGIDRVENAYALSFARQSIQNLVLFDVFHHLEFPGTALAEFQRVLKPGGRVLIFEPYPSLTGLICYGCFHAEPLGLLRPITWMAPEGWSPSDSSYYAAQGNAARVFGSKTYRGRLKGWQLAETKVLTSLSYVASGGFSGPQLYPGSLYPLFAWLDRIAGLAPILFGTRLLVVLERVQDL